MLLAPIIIGRLDDDFYIGQYDASTGFPHADALAGSIYAGR